MNMEDKVKKVGLMKENVVRMCKQLNAQSSLFYLFTLQWKNLEEYLDGVIKGIEDRYGDVKVLEREIEGRDKDVELKKSEMCLVKRKLEEYKAKIGNLESVIEESRRNGCVEEKEKWGLVRNSLEECSLDVVAKESELGEEQVGLVKVALRDQVEITLEKEGVALAEGKHERNSGKLAVNGGDIESVEKYLKGVYDKIRKHQEEFQMKDQQYASIQVSIDKCSQDLDFKRKELAEIELSFRKCSDELESKRKELKLIEESMSKRFKELEMKDNSIRYLEASVKEQSEVLERKREQFEADLKVFEEQKRWVVLHKESIENYARELGTEVKEEEIVYPLEAKRRKSLQFSSQSCCALAISITDESNSSQSHSQSPQAGKRTKELAKKKRCDYHLPPMGGGYTRKS